MSVHTYILSHMYVATQVCCLTHVCCRDIYVAICVDTCMLSHMYAVTHVSTHGIHDVTCHRMTPRRHTRHGRQDEVDAAYKMWRIKVVCMYMASVPYSQQWRIHMYASKWYTRHTRCDMSHNDANMPYDAWQKRVAHAAYKMWHHTTCGIYVHTHLWPRMPCNLCGCVSCCMPCVHTHTCLGLNTCLPVLSVACKCSCMPCVTPLLVYTCLRVLSVMCF